MGAPLSTGAPEREARSLQQLGTVLGARSQRLQQERQALSDRERQLAAQHRQIEADESLLEAQRSQWAMQWRAWTSGGGPLRGALSMQADRRLLGDMAALLAQRRAAWQAQMDALQADLDGWARRWRAAQALGEVVEDRGHRHRQAGERALERHRDEVALQAREALRRASSMRAGQT